MKKITTSFFLFFAGMSMLFSQAGPEILHYRFDGTGTSVPNMASAPPAGTTTATIMGGLSQGSTGQCGGALIGSGISSSTDYLNTGYATSLSGSWTISMWTSNITPSSTLFYIFGDVNASSFRCFTNGVAGANNWILRGPITDVYVSGGATVAPHITTFVYDAVAGNIYAYLDGVLVSTVAESPITLSGAGPFKVMGYSSNVGSPAGGLLDEFRMYSRALSAAEVAGLTFVYHSSATITSCDSYTDPDGRVFNTSGIYSDTLTSYYGCDSLVDLALTLKNSSTGTMTQTACDSYTAPDGSVFTTTGIHAVIIPNFAGCDSTISINLTVNNSSTNTISPVVCNTYTAPDAAVYTTSGIYSAVIPNAIGCDSTITINLTVNNSSASTISPVACSSYTAPDGVIYTSSGMQTAVIPNASGCDSTITINLTVNMPSSSTISPNACGSYIAPDGVIYTSSGTQTAVIPNASGCDSTITMNITVVNLDTTLTVNLPMITSNATGVTYQWIDCMGGSAITGETNALYNVTADGSYAVVISGSGCIDTSSCVAVVALGITQAAKGTTIVYPNPATTDFTVQTVVVPELLTVTDVLGKTIQQIKPLTALTTISMEKEKAGIYFVKVISGNSIEIVKLVKQ